jgi:hypothetical protein
MPLQRYYELLVSQVEVLEEVCITILDIVAVNAVAASNGAGVPVGSDWEEAKQQTLAIRLNPRFRLESQTSNKDNPSYQG